MRTLDPFARLGWFVLPIALVGFGTWGVAAATGRAPVLPTAEPSRTESTVGGMDAPEGTRWAPTAALLATRPAARAATEARRRRDGLREDRRWRLHHGRPGGRRRHQVFRTDTSGGYLYDDSTGRLSQIVPRNLPAGRSTSSSNGTGVYEMHDRRVELEDICGRVQRRALPVDRRRQHLHAAQVGLHVRLQSATRCAPTSGTGRSIRRTRSHILFGDQVAPVPLDRRRHDLDHASGVPAPPPCTGTPRASAASPSTPSPRL